MTFSQVRQYVKGLLSRTFSNKSVLDKLSENDNKLTYNGSQINDLSHTGFTPVGTIISLMGISAPINYLACNGQIINIADYPELAVYFEQQFGNKNHFGGDGTTTFAVPDLRGEFLRGTGTNSHANQGSGSAVGTHQDGTEHPYLIYGTGASQLLTFKRNNNNVPLLNWDKIVSDSTQTQIATSTAYGEYTNQDSRYTSRPTNTSVLYCIATKNIYIDARFDYLTEEKIIGTWIDGKPIYQKTITGITFPSGALNDITIYDTTSLNIETPLGIEATTSNGGTIPYQTTMYNGLNYGVGLKLMVDKVIISTDLDKSSVYGNITITIRYTKTTD